jgi:hypothetical protein
VPSFLLCQRQGLRKDPSFFGLLRASARGKGHKSLARRGAMCFAQPAADREKDAVGADDNPFIVISR